MYKLFFGIDVSSKNLKVCIMNQDGDTLKSFSVKNTLNGAKYLRNYIVTLANKYSCQKIQIGMESTSVYSWHPAMFLNEDKELNKRQAKVYTINAKLIRKFKDAYVDLDKTDDIDGSIQSQIKQLDNAIKKVLDGIQNTLQTIPGIGPVYCAGILAEIGDIHRFMDQASLAKYAGLTWSKYQSGKFEADDTNMIRSGNRYLRFYLVKAANSVKSNEPEFHDYYYKIS